MDFGQDTNIDLKESGDIYEKSPGFLEGLKAGVPIAVGYIPIAIAFGLLAKSAGMPNSISVLMSLMVFAGASQFVAASLISIGSAPWEIIMTVFILNLRHFLMSASESQKVRKGLSKGWMALLSFGITDETFSVASLREEKELGPWFVLGLDLISYSAWVLGTWAGVFMASGLPSSLKSAMGIALYAMFTGLLVPSFRKSSKVLIVSLIAVIINSILNWVPVFNGLSQGWSIVIATAAAAAAGAVIFPEGVNL